MNGLHRIPRRRLLLALPPALAALASCSSGGGQVASVKHSATPPPASPSSSPALGQPSAYLRPNGVYFGVSTYHAPARATTDSVTVSALHHPTILEYFQRWNQEFNPRAVQQSYDQGALPMLTWEPSAVPGRTDQPDYRLSRIASGAFDPYILRFAQQVRDQGRVVVLRFAHEMNGNWYPWSEQVNGNAPGDYVKAWRHIHDVFGMVGATNVIWVWAPNSVRGAVGVALAPLYPGDNYVDWIGVDAYGFGERTAAEILDPTVAELRQITRKPLIISETASKPGAQQAGWTTDLFRWIKDHPDTVGFVWFQHSQDEGGQYDYRFDVDPRTKTAFRQGLDSLSLVEWPVRQH